MNLRPSDTDAFGCATAPIWFGHVAELDKFDRTVASNRHMTFVIDFTDFTTETLKPPGHIDNTVSLILRCIRVGLTRFNTPPEFNT